MNMSQRMDKSKQMSVAVKSKIIKMYENNIKLSEISRQVGFSESCVGRFMKKYRQTDSIERKPGSGRMRVTSVLEDSRIVCMVLKNPYITIEEILKELKSCDVTISRKTVIRRLSEYSYYIHRPSNNLTSEMRELRLNWAKNHQNWTVDDWKRVIFSDESKISLRGRDGIPVPHQENSKSLTVWGCITAYGLRSVTIIEDTMDVKEYKNVLLNFAIPTIKSTKQHTKNPIYQDNSGTCQAVTEFKNSMGIMSLEWLENSPDLNPIENLWSILNAKLENRQTANIFELQMNIPQIWKNDITDKYINLLYESLPKRVSEIIQNHGDFINIEI